MQAAADQLDISWQRLNHYLNGERTIDAYMLYLICTRLGVSPNWLLLKRNGA